MPAPHPGRFELSPVQSLGAGALLASLRHQAAIMCTSMQGCFDRGGIYMDHKDKIKLSNAT